MIKVGSLSHVGLWVRDLDRSIRWYEEMLGFALTERLGPNAIEPAAPHGIAWLRCSAEHHNLVLIQLPPEQAALAKLLPTPEGWTGGDVQLSQVDISSACSYTFARVSYAKDELRVKVTLADTGAHPESLMALASLIAILPEDYDDKVPPATTIKRMKIEESQAAEMWDAEKTTGEITVVVGGRFVVAIEAQTASDLEALRAMLASVDLKALAALK